MDNYWNKNKTTTYFLQIANIEAHHLLSVANSVSLLHIDDGLVRMQFQDEVKGFINAQISVIRSGNCDDDCLACIANLKLEREHLTAQDIMLRTGEASVSATVKFYHDNEKVIGYIIDGIGVILGGLQAVAGAGILAGSIATGNIIGMIAGTSLMFNGVGSAIENIQKLGNAQHPVNFVQRAYEDTASFLGFDRKIGFLAYQAVDLTTSFYGIFKLSLKPDIWRLYRYIPSDRYRKIDTLSKPALAINGVKALYKGSQIGETLYDIKQHKH